MTDNCILRAQHLTASYGRRGLTGDANGAESEMDVLRDMSAEFARGQIHWILGPNGAGKSSFLKVVTGELHARSGSVVFEGMALNGMRPAARVHCGIGRFVQSEWVFPNLSLLDNLLVAAPRQPGENPLIAMLPSARRREAELKELALQHLNEFGFSKQYDVKKTKAGALSCGSAKLLSMVRLMMQDLRLWLLDEPIANVDQANQERICELIRREAKERGKTVIVVEHEVGREGRVSALADRALLLFQGRVIDEGDPLCVKAGQAYRVVFGVA